MKTVICFVSLLLLITAPARAAAAPSFDDWAEEFAAEWVRTQPELATQAQYFAGADQDQLDRQLSLGNEFGGVYGATAVRARATFARRGLDELARFPANRLTAAQRTSAAVIRWTLEDAVAAAEQPHLPFVFAQIHGYHLTVVDFLTSVHPIRNARDVENYLARLALVASRLDEAIADEEEGEKAGYLMPRFLIERVVEQLDGFVTKPAAENVLVTTLDRRIQALGDLIPAARRGQLLAAAETEVRATVLPAFTRVRAALAKQLPHATDDAGIWRCPGGEAAYRMALAHSTTTTLSPDEVHALGLREVARLEKEIDAALQQLGYREGSLNARCGQLDASLPMPSGTDVREQWVARINAVVQDASRRSAADFDLQPKAPVEVRREPEFSEKSAAAHYTPPAQDGSTPGIYWIPLADLGPSATARGAGLKSTAYHEAIPGHHFQLALQQESTELPRYRKRGVFGFNSAFVEGWALYAERLADENGWYTGDAVGHVGYLQKQLFRARRLVVDTGLHTRHWTRQQVIDYGIKPQETERYIVMPGQACSYMVGQLRILELREKAKTALGAKFSLRAFHNVVLRGGSMPLDVLAAEVDAWIAAAK